MMGDKNILMLARLIIIIGLSGLVTGASLAPESEGRAYREVGQSSASVVVIVVPESMSAYSLADVLFIESPPGAFLIEVEYSDGREKFTEERVVSIPEIMEFEREDNITSISVSVLHI